MFTGSLNSSSSQLRHTSGESSIQSSQRIEPPYHTHFYSSVKDLNRKDEDGKNFLNSKEKNERKKELIQKTIKKDKHCILAESTALRDFTRIAKENIQPNSEGIYAVRNPHGSYNRYQVHQKALKDHTDVERKISNRLIPLDGDEIFPVNGKVIATLAILQINPLGTGAAQSTLEKYQISEQTLAQAEEIKRYFESNNLE